MDEEMNNFVLSKLDLSESEQRKRYELIDFIGNKLKDKYYLSSEKRQRLDDYNLYKK